MAARLQRSNEQNTDKGLEMRIQHLPDWLLIDDAAKRIGCSKQTVHNLIERGDIEAFYLGNPNKKPIYVVNEHEVERVFLVRQKDKRIPA